MSPLSVIITIAAYFAILFTVSYIAGRKQTMQVSSWEPQIVLVCGGISGNDWLQHIRSNVCIRARHGCRK